ncbi:MAG: hypothetical protein JSU03_07110 [Bacteroidetes bacterium]|nr:hypothetical protein [Bacteroidota bacterium]
MILLELPPVWQIGVIVVGLLIANGILRLLKGNKDKSKPAKGLLATLIEKAFPNINNFKEDKKEDKKTS